MAKKQKPYIIEKLPGLETTLRLYVDNPKIACKSIETLEGVIKVEYFDQLPVIIRTDPRYNVDEIIREIEELLQAEIPEIFLASGEIK